MDKQVIWLFDNKEYIPYIMKIFEKYPPLTSRLSCELEFFKACLIKNLFFKVSIKDSLLYRFFRDRKLKFSSKFRFINKFNNTFITYSYFYIWLSGFMEIKGSFDVNIKKDSSYSYSFSIEHCNDYYIIYNIYKLYNLNVKIKDFNDMSIVLTTYKKDNLNNIISHCTSYPLQGEKSKKLSQFIKVFYK